MNNYFSIIDQIENPIQTILLGCKSIALLIQNGKDIDFELQKTITESKRLFNIVNTFLEFHIFKDGQVRYDPSDTLGDPQATKILIESKKFYLEALIHCCISFKSSIVELFKVAKIAHRDSKGNSINNTNKIQKQIQSISDSARRFLRAATPYDQLERIYSGESVSIISTAFLVQMKSLTETCNRDDGQLDRDIFDTIKVHYLKTQEEFLTLLRDCVFDISEQIGELSIDSTMILQMSTRIFNANILHLENGTYQDEEITKLNLEQRVINLVDTIKKIFPIVNQSVSRTPTAYPLQTFIRPIDMDYVDILVNNDDNYPHLKEEDQDLDSVINDVKNQLSITNQNNINQSTNNNNQNNNSNNTNNNENQTFEPIRLPTIVLSELSDEEEEDPLMIWSLPISTVSSDPFNKDKPKSASSSASSTPTGGVTPKMYSSKDYDISGSKKSGSKLGSILKSAFKANEKKKDKDKSSRDSSPSITPRSNSGTSSPQLGNVLHRQLSDTFKGSASSPQLQSATTPTLSKTPSSNSISIKST